MSERAAFLDAILNNPDDDAPRLIYSDWLEEHGEPERAEFIRVQCELARLRYDDDRFSDLQAREYRLLSRHFVAWRDEYPYVGFHRGFVEEVRWMRWARFVAAAGLFARHPIRHVDIGPVDLGPGQGGDNGWGTEVATCPHLAAIESLRFNFDRGFLADLGDVLAVLYSPHLTRLTTLDLGGDGEGYGDRGLLTLLGVSDRRSVVRAQDKPLPSLHKLRRLSLSRMGLTDRGLRALAGSPLAETLTELDLAWNEKITANGIRDLIASPLWGRLEGLNLASIRFPDATPVRLVVNALSRSRIKRLGLNQIVESEVRRDLVEALTAAPSWGSLEALDLGWNGLGSMAFQTLTRCPHLARLRWLKLEGNELSDADVTEMAGCPHLAGLTTVRLAGNRSLTNASLKALAGSPFLTQLVDFDVEGTSIQNAGVAAFARSPNAARLRRWVVPGVGDAAVRVIAESPYLGRLTKLRFGSLGGSGRHLAPTNASALALARSDNLPNLSFIDQGWGKIAESGVRALLRCERLAWHGWSRLGHKSPALRRAYEKRFGDFQEEDFPRGDGEFLFPWAWWSRT